MSIHTISPAGFVAKLQKSFQEGTLEVLVGAGASIASGLPSWNELNRRLLSTFLAEEYSDLEFQPRDLDVAARIFVDNFGREAVVDVVRNKLSQDRYLQMLREALYRDGPKDVSSIHLELAALLAAARATPKRRHGLYTFNFDDLLERAAERLLGKMPEVIVEGPRPTKPHVVHLHGYLPPAAGTTRPGTIVLSEKDYHEARGDWASGKLEELFNDDKRTVLMVGLSLADPRLRWLLLERVKRAQQGKPVAHVYALLSNSPPSSDAELMERLAKNFVRRYQEEFWASWQMHVLNIESHDRVPFYLRQIRLGSHGGAWAEKGAAFLRARSPIFKNLYSHGIQERVVSVLMEMQAFLKRRFAVSMDEELHIGGLVPRGGAKIRLGFHYRGGDGKGDIIDDSYARTKELSVASLEKAQGASGHAFLLGATIEASRRSPRVHANFTAPMLETWTRDQTFSSLVCVPIYDSVNWVPIGVVYLTSNRQSPFWTDLDPQDYDALETLLRNTFTEVLEYAPV
ncbi:MAG TPA: SIR2 family protein [Archangium sp.]|nr:SIR2 family protein [Archangium sp.]